MKSNSLMIAIVDESCRSDAALRDTDVQAFHKNSHTLQFSIAKIATTKQQQKFENHCSK